MQKCVWGGGCPRDGTMGRELVFHADYLSLKEKK